MLREVERTSTGTFQGLVTFKNFYNLGEGASPSLIDVKINVDGSVEKRLGSNTLNTTILVSTAATGFSPDSSASLGTNLIAYWKMDETSGPRGEQVSERELTDVNTVESTTGRVSNGGLFVRADSTSLTRTSDSALETGDIDFTVSAWVYFNGSGGDSTVINKGRVGNREYDLFYDVAPSPTLRLELYNGNNTLVGNITAASFGAIVLNTWYNVVGWHDATNNFAGISVNLSVSTDATSGAVGASGGEVRIGGFINESGGAISGVDGIIDEVGFWKKVLTAQERSDLYNSGTGNTYNGANRRSGWGSFDFGAGTSLRHLTVAAGTGIYASSNRGVTFVAIATDRTAHYQSFERSKSWLIATSDTYNAVLYWAGSVGTFMSRLAPNSAPVAKLAANYAGFLLLMNDSQAKRQITYSDDSVITTDPWDDTFELPSSLDDEITDFEILNRNLYVSTKYRIFRVSHVGGNPDFSVQKVKDFGVVPKTWSKVFLRDVGEVLVGLSYDKRVRVFDGSQDRVLSDSIEQDNGLSQVSLEQINELAINRSHSVFDTKEQVYKLWVAIKPSIQVTHVLCFNVRNAAWYAYQNQNFNTAVMAESANELRLLAVSRVGNVQIMDSSNTDIGTAINDHFDSIFYVGALPREVRKSQKLHLSFDTTSSGTLYFQDRLDFERTYRSLREVFVLGTNTPTLQNLFSVDVPETQNVYQWRISSSANTASPWRLNRADYEYQTKGGGKG